MTTKTQALSLFGDSAYEQHSIHRHDVYRRRVRDGGGYVLNFSDRTFAQFFAEELNIDIDDSLYARNGGSKAKRLRCFLQTVDKPTVVRTLKALWEYREALRQRSEQADKVPNAHGRLLSLLNRLEGRPESAPSPGQAPIPAFDRKAPVNTP